MSFNFTCISCRVGFSDADIHRIHFKTDWHRYNLKRKVANFLPVTSEEFARRVLQQQEDNKLKDTSTYCKVCKKTFSCGKAFDNHLNSKKHKAALINFEISGDKENLISAPANIKKKRNSESQDVRKDSGTEEDFSTIEDVDPEDLEVDDEEGLEISEDNPILQNNCLFCTHHSSSMTKNLKHMSIEHSFFVPDIDYVIDLRNLLLYLGEKVCRLYICLWCNDSGRQLHSMEAAQRHMRDKGHCKVLHEGSTLAEFHHFYDYSKSYPDYEEGMDDDEELEIPEIEGGAFTLTLPSGGSIGHRSLLTYYRQHYNSDRPVPFKRSNMNNVISTYRALGWVETDKAVAVRKDKAVRYLAAAQSQKTTMQLGVKANKLQEHFRPQVNF